MIPVEHHSPIINARRWLASRSNGHRLHAGVDLSAPAGTPVRAPVSGVLRVHARASYGADTPRWARPIGWAGYGPECVLIEGDDGTWHLLAHVDRVRFAVGDRVAEGMVVAQVAARGRHCHWEVRDRARPPAGWATVEIALNPLRWLEGTRERYLDLDPRVCPVRPVLSRLTPRACRPRRAVA